ncbi:uncharacterized protein A1O9_08609 [Exophiala aquamarina CBS 119918]|uniref:Pre-mRNA-splicing factor SLU7 n=1 Tax=Exophiala aquamarina CBS 119918 TaxID=1182545 RepID=A0A072P5F6_9EURO|nr:uncharacterized protein A1O9_08609 [Exophiala aquamarina CBS 119918]KEF54957.1 hypothetical protein A1O9_08609 [Exophiala aquamarina CBS 119918]
MSSNKPPGPDQSRNEYIPSFISKRPFWAETTSDADYLEHQRLQTESKDTLDKAKWYDRGKKLGPAATKFRKGACENCGAMTHKTKECLSRPRKLGAKWTGKDIQADEIVEDVKLGWDAKRDRWNGYDNREYGAVVQEYEELEALKRAAATNKSKDGTHTSGEATSNGDSDARYGEETDMGRSQPTSTRQLRLREDTAKYLINLDLDSARYDPKTRSMDTSTQALSTDGDTSVAEENFIRPSTNDSAAFVRAQQYAWETQEKSNPTTKKLHLQANPTEGEILHKKLTIEAAEKKAAARKALLDKYGGFEHLQENKLAKSNAVLASERYVEYDSHGHIKGQPVHKARSKYAEDVLTNNHTSVWGSWWRNFTWGYACCHSTVKNSYCTGDAGKKAFEDTEGLRTGQALLENGGQQDNQENSESKGKLTLEQQGEDLVERKHTQQLDTTAISSISPAPTSQSMEDNTAPTTATSTAKKRTIQEIQSGISEEDLESYKRNRRTADDPMANMLGRDELVQ